MHLEDAALTALTGENYFRFGFSFRPGRSLWPKGHLGQFRGHGGGRGHQGREAKCDF